MRVLITGATGFIGSEIVSELLDNGFEIFQVGKSNISSRFPPANYFKIDITSLDEVLRLEKLKEADAIVHSAGLAHQFGEIEKEEFQKTNVTGTRNILELAVSLKVRHFILIGSTAVYGKQKSLTKNGEAIDENAICRPQTFYAESKLEAERAALEVCGRNNINLTIFRLAPVIGEGNAGNVARLVEAIDKNRFLWIGDGENYKSLIYKKDVARACREVLIKKKEGIEIFNLAAAPVMMQNFVTTAAKKMNKKIPGFSIPPSLLRIVFELNKKTLQITKIQKISDTVDKWLSEDIYSAEAFEQKYNFRPQVDICDGLEKQIDWYQTQKKIGEDE